MKPMVQSQRWPCGHQGYAAYLHDGRLLTLEDTVEYFNLVLALKLGDQDKAALVAYMSSSKLSSHGEGIGHDIHS
jgi:hypothetical protein